MTNEERVEVCKAAEEVASEFTDRIVIPHVGCIDTESTVELAKAADEIGVDGITAVPSFYYKHSEDLVITEFDSEEPFFT